MHEFLNSVKKYPQWPHSNKHKGNSKDFQNAFEIMFVVLWSIWDKPYWENSPSNDTPSTPKEEEFRKIRKKEFEENLYLYGKRTGITEERQKELIRKVKNAHWDAPEFIRSYGFTEKDNKRKSGFKKFAEAYLRICLDDRVIEYSELRLIYLAVYFLNIDLHELTHYTERPSSQLGIVRLFSLNVQSYPL